MGLKSAVVLKALSEYNYVFAPESGMYETLFDPGEHVRAGDVVGRLHFFERPDREAVEMRTPIDGVVCAVRAHVPTAQGDCVAVIGEPVSIQSLYEKAQL